MSLSGGSDWAWVITIPAGFFVIGLVSGIGQWAVLRNYFNGDDIFLWIPLTAIGLPVGFILGTIAYFNEEQLFDKISNSWVGSYGWSSTTTIACVAGAFLGILQWFVIRKKLKGSLWWIPISSLIWGIGTTIIVEHIYIKSDFENGIILGGIVGAISGITMILMLASTKEIWNKKTETEISLKSEI